MEWCGQEMTELFCPGCGNDLEFVYSVGFEAFRDMPAEDLKNYKCVDCSKVYQLRNGQLEFVMILN